MDQTRPEQLDTIDDADRDSLWRLPLLMMPIEHNALKQTKIVKNNHLESVIELFSDKDTGKGHVHPADLKQVFSSISSSDLDIIHTLAKLDSYDVYSLRITLRQNGIEIDNYDDLKLSESKQKELRSYMQPFLQQLVLSLFGPGNNPEGLINGQGIDWLSLFQNPDASETRERLKNMAVKLDIPILEVPKFIQEYGDVYLSVAYYRECLDKIKPTIHSFLRSTTEILNHQQLSQNYSLQKVCSRLKTKVEKIEGTLGYQLSVFGTSNLQMWEDMSPESFKSFRETVHSNHTKMGGLMCALAVKMNAWQERFPKQDDGGPLRRADFILTDMGQGW